MLTKSDLQSWRQCPRKLWLEQHRPEVAAADELTTYRRATDGNVVGRMARELLGSQILWPAAQESRELAAEATKQLLAGVRDRPAVEVPMVREGRHPYGLFWPPRYCHPSSLATLKPSFADHGT